MFGSHGSLTRRVIGGMPFPAVASRRSTPPRTHPCCSRGRVALRGEAGSSVREARPRGRALDRAQGEWRFAARHGPRFTEFREPKRGMVALLFLCFAVKLAHAEEVSLDRASRRSRTSGTSS